jgi:hypothetical protein
MSAFYIMLNLSSIFTIIALSTILTLHDGTNIRGPGCQYGNECKQRELLAHNLLSIRT